MRVQVDEAGRDELARRVDDLRRGLGRDVAVDGGDPVAGDRDVEAALVPAARIDDVAAADQQVEPRHASNASRIRSSVSRRRKP